jgi:hypothetical protein
MFDVTALAVSSTFVDLELVFYFLVENHMNHGFCHSYLSVLTIYPVVLSVIIYLIEARFRDGISRVYGVFRFFPRKVHYPFKTVYFTCLIGGFSHIFFDMWVHETSSYILFPFYSRNPFWIGRWSIIIDAIVGILSLYTVYLWIRQIKSQQQSAS